MLFVTVFLSIIILFSKRSKDFFNLYKELGKKSSILAMGGEMGANKEKT